MTSITVLNIHIYGSSIPKTNGTNFDSFNNVELRVILIIGFYKSTLNQDPRIIGV